MDVPGCVTNFNCNSFYDKALFEDYCECWTGTDLSNCDSDTQSTVTQWISGGCSNTDINYLEPHRDRCITVDSVHEGRIRCWDEFVFDSVSEGAPIVIDFHSARSSAAEYRESVSKLDKLAETEGFIYL